jgi:hypothetical protein
MGTDLNQHRLDTALAAPRGEAKIQQSFYSGWDGLQEIELVLARPGQVKEEGRLQVQLLDDSGVEVAAQTFNTRVLNHNQSLTFTFLPQAQSAGRRYVLQITGSENNPVSVWGYSLDVYGSGSLRLINEAASAGRGETAAQELRFTTHYRLTWTDALIALGTALYWDGLIMVVALLLIPLPGCLLLMAGPKSWRRWDPGAWWGVAFALGVSVWPFLWFGLSLAGGRWAAWSLWLLFALGWAAVILVWWRRRRQGKRAERQAREGQLPLPLAARASTWKWQHGLLLLLLLTSLAARLLAVRGLAFPLWVDASRHALITAVMAVNGQTPENYEPFLAVERFPYHFGFHTLSASLRLMTGWPLPRLLLFLGQLLNGLVPLTLYTAVWFFRRKQGPSLLAAFLVGLPFFLPGYYATWGRLTQLTAVFLMPVLLAFTWLLARGGRGWRRAWWLIALLAGGLFLVHFRVFLFYVPFAAIVWLFTLGRNGRWLAAAMILALALVGPRLLELSAVTEPVLVLSSTIPNYNAFPTTYYQAGWERYFVWLAGAGLFLTLVFGLWRPSSWRWRRWMALPIFLAIWVASLFLLLAGEPVGLPESSLVNLNSMYITLFLPLAIFLAVTAEHLWRWLGQGHWLLQVIAWAAAGAVMTATFLFGLRQQITILNPQTILAQAEDLAGLRWVEDHLPQRATIAVNSWLWLGNTWAGSDGGAWLVPLTARASTTPPVDYVYNQTLFQFVGAFNEAATAASDWADPSAAEWLRQQGVTHVFIGARGGFFDPAALARNPAMKMLYGRDGVFVFEIRK